MTGDTRFIGAGYPIAVMEILRYSTEHDVPDISGFVYLRVKGNLYIVVSMVRKVEN